MTTPSNNNNRIKSARSSLTWEKDHVQTTCTECHIEFSPLNRRHHCRLCGKIFCRDCSKQRSLIPPSAIVLIPKGEKKSKQPFRRDGAGGGINAPFSHDDDSDRTLTYFGDDEENVPLYGKGLEERFTLAREPLRVCDLCHEKLRPLQMELRASNSNAVRYNSIDPTDVRRLFNSPIAFTLGHEVRKAAYTLNNLLPLPKKMGLLDKQPSYTATNPTPCTGLKENCSTVSPNLSNIDGVHIPTRLLEKAKGVAVMTVARGGCGLGVEFGTGLVVARLGAFGWSAPSAIGTVGVCWGALVGAQVSDHVFLLMTDAAVEMMASEDGSLQLGVDVG
eukprot:CAMPEP_0172516626 /NCGR_PEP_ID=MMETSP1066-20121228/277825_1 /TAXON_ID=671091 /ORGANISM="Coscinodiscus wailesii, Strain CCMP2513" /LENGTH=332 /DNA_ID=CAMNT_0013298191 /DNA_START=158 /DNA_END=1152 /DNA_ORIENTATION=-